MKYSPLAVHCSSLCLDVIFREDFSRMSDANIHAFFPDICDLIDERLQTPIWDVPYSHQLPFIVSRKMVVLLCYLKRHPEEVDAARILYEINDVIGTATKRIVSIRKNDPS